MRIPPASLIILCSLPLSLASCASESSKKAPRPQLTAQDFSDPSATPPQPAERVAPVYRTIDQETARGGATDVIVITGAPTQPPRPSSPPAQAVTTPPAQAPGENAGASPTPAASVSAASPGTERLLLIDQLVGQINGRPIYADEFFEPMDERLRRESERLSAREWIAMARKDIEAALWDKIRDELLLAEFQGSLTPEQRQGILAFVDSIRKDFVSGNLGSEALASQRLREAEGLDLEAKVQDVSQREFIAFQLRKAIGSRVNVSARDIQLYFDQNQKDFSPPPVAKFVILRVPIADELKLADAEQGVASAEPFESLAARLSTWRPDAANTSEIVVENRDLATATLFGAKALNEAAQKLSPGQVSPRIDLGTDAMWIKLRELETKPGKTLYEVQLEIEKKIRADRVREEEIRYFDQLFSRGSYSDIKQMTRRLVEFAADRYLVRRELQGGGPVPTE